MTLFERSNGVARSNQPAADRETAEEVLATKPVHPADSAVKRKAGRRSGELADEGLFSLTAYVVGATAEVVEGPALTRHVDDFARPGVDVEPN